MSIRRLALSLAALAVLGAGSVFFTPAALAGCGTAGTSGCKDAPKPRPEPQGCGTAGTSGCRASADWHDFAGLGPIVAVLRLVTG